MTDYDRDFWEGRWSEALRDHGERAAGRPPSTHLTAAVADLHPGRALDAGCGHGSEALWLAARGWRVTAVDFSATALAFARSRAVEAPVEWVEADLAVWTPEPAVYDLVVSLYVHIADSVNGFVRRMASGVAPDGTLFLVGAHPANGQVQVSVQAALEALDPLRWEVVVAEERPRTTTDGSDAVIRARLRRSAGSKVEDQRS